GCTLFFALTGEPVFGRRPTPQLMSAHLKEPPPRISDFRQDASPELDAVVDKMLAKDARQRYRTMLELMDALQPLAPSYSREMIPKVNEDGWSTAGAAAVSAVAAVVMTVVAFLIFGSRPRPDDPNPKEDVVAKADHSEN